MQQNEAVYSPATAEALRCVDPSNTDSPADNKSMGTSGDVAHESPGNQDVLEGAFEGLQVSSNNDDSIIFGDFFVDSGSA